MLEEAARVASPWDLRFDIARALEALATERRNDSYLERAIEAYRSVLAIAPDEYRAHYAIARLLARSGRTEEARAEMRLFQEAHRQVKEAEQSELRSVAAAEHALDRLQQGDAQGALEQLQGLAQIPDVLRIQALVHLALGDSERAAASLERAVSLAPDRLDIAAQLNRLRLARPR